MYRRKKEREKEKAKESKNINTGSLMWKTLFIGVEGGGGRGGSVNFVVQEGEPLGKELEVASCGKLGKWGEASTKDQYSRDERDGRIPATA